MVVKLVVLMREVKIGLVQVDEEYVTFGIVNIVVVSAEIDPF